MARFIYTHISTNNSSSYNMGNRILLKYSVTNSIKKDPSKWCNQSYQIRFH